MTDFIDDFLAGLENDKPKPRTDFSRLNKILMSAGPNQGTIMFAPFMDPKSSKFYRIVPGVREMKTTVTKFHDGNDDVWVKILPEDAYGTLSEEDHNLYSEVAGMFDQYAEYYNNTDPAPWNYVRYRSYSIFQGIVLNHADKNGAVIEDNVGHPALIMFPTKTPITELANAISAKIANLKNKEWLTKVFSTTDSGREGALSIKFTKSDNIGYDTSVSFEFNSTFSVVIDPNFSISQEIKDLFGDFISSFIGWENSENGLFDRGLFSELKQVLTIELKKIEAGSTPTTDEQPENKNGNDPMLEEKKEDPKPEETKPEGDFPF
jgi:hypothetical protein